MNAEVRTQAEAEVRAVLDSWCSAVRAGDIDGITAHYHPDIVAFDAASALQFKGVDAYGKHWQACLAMFGEQVCEVHQVAIAAADDVAFCHALVRCGGVAADGTEQAGWTRMTAGYRKSGGRWRVVHEHFSAPFDMQTLKMLELEP